MAVGFSFGATSGLTDEGISQYQKGIFDPLRLAERTLLQGGADALGAAGGYGIGRLYSTPQVHPVFKNTNGSTLTTTVKDASLMLCDRVNLELGNGIPHTRYEKYLAERFPALRELIDSKPIPKDRTCRFQIDNSKDSPQIWHDGTAGSKVYLQPAPTDLGKFLKLGDPVDALHERAHAANFKLEKYTEPKFRDMLLEDESEAVREGARAARQLNRTSAAETLESLVHDAGAVVKTNGTAFDRAWESTKGDTTKGFVQYKQYDELNKL